MSRLAGICLIGLGVACWPSGDTLRAFYGMVTYSTLAMLYLIYIGVHGEAVGPLLWPAVVAHAVLNVLLFRAIETGKDTGRASTEPIVCCSLGEDGL